MMKKFGLAVMAFALFATVVSASNLPRHPMTGEEVPSPFRPFPGGGKIALHNYDWVPYTVEVNPHNFTIHIRSGARHRRPNSVVITPGAKLYIPSPQHVWHIEGNNGRRLDLGVRSGRKTDVDMVPNGERGMIGLEVIIRDHKNTTRELLIAWEHREEHGRPKPPPPPPPQPYSDPNPGIGHGAHYDPGIGQGAHYGDPGIGQGAHYGDPYGDPYAQPLPVIGQDGQPVPVIGQGAQPLPVINQNPSTYYGREDNGGGYYGQQW